MCAHRVPLIRRMRSPGAAAPDEPVTIVNNCIIFNRYFIKPNYNLRVELCLKLYCKIPKIPLDQTLQNVTNTYNSN